MRQRDGDGGVSPHPWHADAGGGLDAGDARQRPDGPGAPEPGGHPDGERILSRRRTVGHSAALWQCRRLAGGRVSAHRPGPRRAAGPAAGRLTPVAPNARARQPRRQGKKCDFVHI